MTETSATAFAPATIGNVGVGFDVLGLAIAGAGDTVVATRSDGDGVVVAEVQTADGRTHPDLEPNSATNTASVAASALWRAHGRGGVSLVVRKGIPLQSGMGSSAASAVAGVVAVNALLDEPLPREALLEYALVGEASVSGGQHADNVAPCLFGGLVVCPPTLHPMTLSVPVPDGVSSVLLHPELSVNTEASRRGLKATVTRAEWVNQQGLLAAFVTACATGNVDALAPTLEDLIIEPQRAAAVPCLAAVKRAALDAGALGGSLSGSGPSIFMLARDADAAAVGDAMLAACRAGGIDGQVWISPMASPGARITD